MRVVEINNSSKKPADLRDRSYIFDVGVDEGLLSDLVGKFKEAGHELLKLDRLVL
jgi:hypothetical protein